ncbi:MAG: tRNA preQ1(34) S-adenosylmethionine ribosyltransferase-isomerase QueA [Chloroflexota bacterium]
MKTSDFDYQLPQELIAQTPLEPRDQSRLLVINRRDSSLEHHKFIELVDYLESGDVLVLNNSQVMPSRLRGKRADSQDSVELLLLRQLTPNVWETLVKCDKRVNIGTRIEITGNPSNNGKQNSIFIGEVTGFTKKGGKRIISFPDGADLLELGEIPLPPYIRIPLKDPERYQTVYASMLGSAAAPTAGLHFTNELIDKIKSKGVHCTFVTLHIGLDTFRPVRVNNSDKHPIHQEYGIIGREAAAQLSQARRDGRRIISVGTSTTRLLEAAAQASDLLGLKPFEGWVSLFILPGYRFQMVDGLITNFHLPRSTLLMMVTAFAGREMITRAYCEAMEQTYRFYSFGDAMFII